eukprot:scaffold635383_cov13-Prasinocladus_malaysianus.AAC.1
MERSPQQHAREEFQLWAAFAGLICRSFSSLTPSDFSNSFLNLPRESSKARCFSSEYIALPLECFKAGVRGFDRPAEHCKAP